jgi:MFS transporter, putative metabolite:H+ symporter
MGFAFFFEFADINTFAYVAPAILRGWHLSISGIGTIVSATFFGMFLGATSAGWLSDRVGRKKALIYTALWYSIFSLLNAFVWEPVGMLTCRLLTGIGLSALTVVGITYISEMFPTTKRGACQSLIMTIGLFGIPVTAYVARFTIPMAAWAWRLVFVWGSLGLIFAPLASRLEESPRWLENQGLVAEAESVLARIEQRTEVNRKELSPSPTLTESGRSPGSYRDLFSRRYLRQTIILNLAWVFQTLGLVGFMAWVPTLLVAHGFSLVNSLSWSSAISLGAIPGTLIAALISDRWERKWLITILAMIIAVCGLLYGMSFKTAPIIIFGFLVAMFLQTFAPIIYAYTPEAYPTEIRNSGVGLAYGIGRLANTGGPLVIAFLYDHYTYTSVFVYIAMCWVLVAITIGGFGLSTKGRILA